MLCGRFLYMAGCCFQNFRRIASPLGLVALSPDEFRDKISCSKIVVDTHTRHQTGLTARFMWALGARKKIVTTNSSISQYDFFSKEQIYVLTKPYEFGDSFSRFANSPLVLSNKVESSIDRFRIDNWLSTILSLDF